MSDWLRDWDNFFFGPRELWSIAIFRVMACGSLFFLYLRRQPRVTDFYTGEGLLPRELIPQFMSDFYRPAFNWYFWPDAWMPEMHLLLLVLLALLTLGVGGRKICWAAWILHMAFNQRNMMVMYGADIVGSLWLFYLSFCRSNAHLNLWDWLRRSFSNRNKTFSKERKSSEEGGSDVFTSMGVRLIQIQLCIIYFYTGLEKLKGLSWWDGTALWLILGNPEMRVMDLEFLLHVPLLLALVSFVTILFEVYFPFGIWLKSFRPWWMLIGIFLHIGIAVTMGLYFFSILMLAGYVLFVPGLLAHFRDDGFSNSYSVASR